MNLAFDHLLAYRDVVFIYQSTNTSALPGPLLVDMLAMLGQRSRAGAKSLLHRMAELDMVHIERRGRVGVYRISDHLVERAESYEQVVSRARPTWSGQFHAIIYDVPESHRSHRDKIRTDAERSGYVALRPGLMISLDDRSGDVAALHNPMPECHVWTGWLATDLETARRAVARAWEVEELDRACREHVQVMRALIKGPEPTGQEALVKLYAAVMPAVPLRLRDSGLPAELSPPGSYVEFMEAYDQAVMFLAPAALAYAAEAFASSPYSHLVVSRDAA